jgi:hypothetical protein
MQPRYEDLRWADLQGLATITDRVIAMVDENKNYWTPYLGDHPVAVRATVIFVRPFGSAGNACGFVRSRKWSMRLSGVRSSDFS